MILAFVSLGATAAGDFANPERPDPLPDPSPPPVDLGGWGDLGTGYICRLDPKSFNGSVHINRYPECGAAGDFIVLKICSSHVGLQCPLEEDYQSIYQEHEVPVVMNVLHQAMINGQRVKVSRRTIYNGDPGYNSYATSTGHRFKILQDN